MSPTIEDLRTTLDGVAHEYAAPDPQTVLAGAYARSGELGRRRTTQRWAAAAAAVVAIGGASLLLTDPGADTQGEVAPAEPDESYTEGYGFVGGVPQPYADGLTLVETFDDLGPDGGSTYAEPWKTDADTQMYVQAWCASGTARVEIKVGEARLTAPCADPTADTAHLESPVPLPRGAEGFSVDHRDPAGGTGVVAMYEETPWRDYPFPTTETTPFPPAEGVLIDNSTPESVDPTLDALPSTTQVHSATVPISEAMTTFIMELDQPGQLLVAIDGVVLTNDGETVGGTQQPAADPWRVASPALREGYLNSYGSPVSRSVDLNAQILAEEGIDVSDGEVTVSAYARGFVDDASWRVVIGAYPGAVGGGAGPEPLTLTDTSDFAEYAFGQRLVAAYEVPTDGVAHPVDLDPRNGVEITWVPQCPEEVLSGEGDFQPDIGTVTVADTQESLRCLVSDGWQTALPPSGLRAGGSDASGATIAVRRIEGLDGLAVAAYTPVPFEDFPFADREPLFDDAAPQDGEVFGGGLVFGVTDLVTSADLDAEGSATIEIPESRLTQLYVTTEGKGRFWLDSADPAEGAITGAGSPSSPENNYSGTLGRDDWWTSWTDQRATWPITARTDSGQDPERVVLRVEGYEEGSFELRVIGQFPEGEQP